MGAMPGTNMGTARELFDAGANCRGEDVNITVTPYDREEGRSWRHVTECTLLTEPYLPNWLVPGSKTIALLFCPLGISLLVARWTSCWLLSLPGIVFLCVPVCP